MKNKLTVLMWDYDRLFEIIAHLGAIANCIDLLKTFGETEFE
ncbi:hypothetical protein [Nostoc sp. CHAB 5836]|nr:hypothetical protein [Nostoc sp. CHAB 5836]